MRLLLLFLGMMLGFQTYAQRTCGAHHLHEELMTSDPDYAKRHAEIESLTAQFLRDPLQAQMLSRGEINIPVVFHVLYNTAAQNISEQRILEQLKTLNDDFNASNPDTSLIPNPFKPLKGAFSIKFVLANRDPQGNPTTGIIRKQTTRTGFSYGGLTTPTAQPMKFNSQGGSDAWDTRSYLNIWVCNMTDGTLGFATFPASAGTVYDGVVLATRYTGTTGATAPYNKGRTGTHEVGHYFNLRHIWGDANNCSASDFVDDTPNQRNSTGGCPSWPISTDPCSPGTPGIMFMNYMDYTNDACMYMFTQGQVGRMQAALNGPRASLLNSRGYVEDRVNDLSIVGILSPNGAQCSPTFTPQLTFTNRGTNEVNSFSATYQISGRAAVSRTWTGTLAPQNSATVEFDAVTVDAGYYFFNAYSSQPNGSTDTDPSNDSIFGAFSIADVNASISGATNLCSGDSVTLTASTCSDLNFNIGTFASRQYIVWEFEPSGAVYPGNPIPVNITVDQTRTNTLRIVNFGDFNSPQPAFLSFNPNTANPIITVLETATGFIQNGTGLVWTGTGRYDICTKSFTVNYSLKDPSTGQLILPASKVFGNADAPLPLNFSWSNGATTPSIKVSPTATTQFTLTITAANGCTARDSITVTVNPKATPTFNSIPAICSGTPAPVLPGTSNNGITGSWSPSVSNTSSGTYTFTPGPGQCAVNTSLNIVVNQSVTPQFNPIAAFCAGTPAPVLPPVSINGITGTWSPGNVSNTSSSTYTFNATDAGCYTPTVINVTVKPLPPAPLVGSNSPVLAGNEILLTAGTITGASYSWSGPNGFTSNLQNPSILSATTANAGEYSAFATVGGCDGASSSVTVIVNTETPVVENSVAGMLIAPNPFRYSTTLSFDLPESKRVVISITDISGRALEKQIVNAGSGRNVFEVGRDLVSGTYLLSVDTGSEIKTLKMVVLN
jgi:hypothetical protein